MPVEVEEGTCSEPLGLDGSPPWPTVIDVVLKNVASKTKAAASVMSASPRPRRRSESSARMTATAAANDRADKPTQEQIRARDGWPAGPR